MDWETIAKVLAAFLAASAATAKALSEVSGRYAARARIERDLNIYERLPSDSDVRQVLLSHIEGAVRRVVENETEKRRDPAGVVLAGAFLSLAAWAVSEARSGARLWWVLAGTLAILGAVGMSVSLPLARRDERGRVIK